MQEEIIINCVNTNWHVSLFLSSRRRLMFRVYLGCTLLAVLFSFESSSSTKVLTSFVPENNFYISTFNKSVSNVTEEQFNETIERIYQIYSPIIEEMDNNLVINGDWESGTVNAYAQQIGINWQVKLFGGLARHPSMTQDGFALVACHEIGHHIGGYPKKSGWYGSMWASAEGQSDYYGASKCLKRYFATEDNLLKISEMNIDPLAISECNKVYSNYEEAAICKRVAMAGLALGKLFEDLQNLDKPIKFSTPDLEEVKRTNVAGYPKTQCRFDTYFAGALCDKVMNSEADRQDEATNFCARKDNYEIGVRPRCWYKPPSRYSHN